MLKYPFQELSLFTGAGGGVYASKILGHRVVGYVESELYLRKLIYQRIKDKIFDEAPIYSDIRKFSGIPYRGKVDLITAGFPCQPFSVAGKRKAGDDNRNMWPETLRVCAEAEAPFILLENVPGLLGRHQYFGKILRDLASIGYDAEWGVFSASEVGAPHRRKRLFILAYTECSKLWLKQWRAESGRKDAAISADDGEERVVADSRCKFRNEVRTTPRQNKSSQNIHNKRCGSEVADAPREYDDGAGTAGTAGRNEHPNGSWWESEPDVDRMAHGVADRVNRLAALGNGQVPATVVLAFQTLMNRI